MHIFVHSSLAEIDAQQWDAMIDDNNPFMLHGFLHGLEVTGCTNLEHGWQPCHVAVYADKQRQQLIAAMPCYIKHHSYGEYIFDWVWADAYHRSGIEYYPKLSNAVPFTPATGPRWLIKADTNQAEVSNLLVETIKSLVTQNDLSSFHSLFLPKEQADLLATHDFCQRVASQFHWQNKQPEKYQSFDDFLAALSSKKRKNIKRERRRVQEAKIQFQWLTGSELNKEHAKTMHRFYRSTIDYYGAQPYLNLAFFNYLVEHFSDHTLMLFVQTENEPEIIAGGLYFKSDNTLYGRYWGALQNYHSLHFETCYYQAIEWCIQNGYQRFEAGAQGEHKLARGLEPSTVYSCHWIEHPQLRAAIENHVDHEGKHIEQYQQTMQAHSPFKSTEND